MSSSNSLGEADYPLPIGVMTFWCGDATGVLQPPTGWIICDGTEKSQTEFPLLYNIVGDQFGTASDPSTLFVLPSVIGGTFTQSDGKLPSYLAANTGITSAGAAGVANLNFTLTSDQMPPLSPYDAATGVGIDVANTTWTSLVNNSRSVAINDTSGASSSNSGTSSNNCVRHNNPAQGIRNIVPTQISPNMTSYTNTPTPYTGTINLDGEVPARYEMPIIIKASN